MPPSLGIRLAGLVTPSTDLLDLMVGLVAHLTPLFGEVEALLSSTSEANRVVEFEAALRGASTTDFLAQVTRWSGRDDPYVLSRACASLKAIDWILAHRSEELLHAGTQVEGPGGSQWQVWPGESTPIPSRTPLDEQLERGPTYFAPSLRTELGLHWRVFPVPAGNGVMPRWSRARGDLWARMEERLDDGELVVGLATPFAALSFAAEGFKTERLRDGSVPYCFIDQPAEEQDKAAEELEGLLAWCVADSVDILVLPELTVSPSVLDRLRKLRKAHHHDCPALIVAGSYHITCSDTHHRRNRCVVLDALGKDVLVHDKHQRFAITPNEAAHMPPEVVDALGIDEQGGIEHIVPSRRLALLDTPLGRVSVPICLDYIGATLRHAWEVTGTNVFFVPTMSPRFSRFPQRAREWGDVSSAASFIVNSAWLPAVLGLPAAKTRLGHVYLPRRKASQDWPLTNTHRTPAGTPVQSVIVKFAPQDE